jgi:hypothetical protein
MARITRRRVLKLSGAGVMAAQTGGLATILATRTAPAFAQEYSLGALGGFRAGFGRAAQSSDRASTIPARSALPE